MGEKMKTKRAKLREGARGVIHGLNGQIERVDKDEVWVRCVAIINEKRIFVPVVCWKDEVRPARERGPGGQRRGGSDDY